jgi:hypothetical protein
MDICASVSRMFLDSEIDIMKLNVYSHDSCAVPIYEYNSCGLAKGWSI